MNAPDKIYVHEASAPELAEPVLKEYHIEYIRKDALLEWAVYMRDKNQFGNYEYSLFQTIIDKLNSM